MIKIRAGRVYSCPNSSLYIRVLKVYHATDMKVSVKLSFEYKNGMVCEIKSYRLKLENIQHWLHVQY